MRNSLIRNGVSGILQKIIRLSEQLLIVPFFITSWGINLYGEWLTLTIIPSMLTFLELGFGTSLSNSLVLRYIGGEVRIASGIAKLGIRLISATVGISIIISSIAIFVILKCDFLAKSLIHESSAAVALSFLMLSRIFDFYQQYFDGFFRAVQKAHVSVNLLSFYSLLKLFGGITILSLGGGVISFGLVDFIISILFNLSYGIAAYKVIKFPKAITLTKNEVNEIVKKGFSYLLSPIWQIIYFQGTTLAIRIIIGPAAVALFNTLRTITRSINQVFNLINTTILPELQYELSKGNMDKVRSLYRGALFLSVTCSLIGICVFIICGSSVYNHWTRNHLNPSNVLWYISYAGIVLNAFWWTSLAVFWAKNEPFRISRAGLIASCISVFMTYCLSIKYDIVGAAIGVLVFDILMSIWVLPISFLLIDQRTDTLYSDLASDLRKFKLRISDTKIFKLLYK